MTESLADRVRSRLEALRISPYAASMRASDGASKDLVKNILNGRSLNPRADTLKRLAEALETTVEALVAGDQDGPPPRPATIPLPKSNARMAVSRYPAPIVAGQRNLPIMRTAAGSLGKGSFHLEDSVIDYVIRPDVLRDVPDAYGIYVDGDSMYPAHPHGELRIVHPHRPCQVGDTVVIIAKYTEDGPTEAWIKQLVRRSGDRIIVEQFNPKATIEFDKRFVVSCHKVLTMNDLLGM